MDWRFEQFICAGGRPLLSMRHTLHIPTLLS